MKKALLIALGIMAGLTMHTNAQVTSDHKITDDMFIGPTLGGGSTWVNKMVPYKDFKALGKMGISFLYASGYTIGWGADLVISAEGYKRNDITEEHKLVGTQSVTPIYLRLPLRMYYMVKSCRVVRPMVFVGPAFGYKMAEYSEENKVTGSMFLRQNSNDFKKFDVGINAGAGLLFRFNDHNWLHVNGSYYHGLVDAFIPYYRDNEIENISVNIGMLFAIR